ncbi:2391_t:CDS:1, partial [Cetraspora pellucida]
ITAEKVSNITKLHTYYITNAQNELNYITHKISESEFEQVIENYASIVEFDDDMFNENIEDEDLNANYISDTKNLNNLLQFDNENLSINEMLDLNVFLNKKTTKKSDNNLELDDVYNYDIEVINAST